MTRYLFTTLPSNDLGLLTRSLPLANELARRGHIVDFCSPGLAPSKLIAEAGFANLLPAHPVYHLLAAQPSLRGLYRLLRSPRFRRDFGNVFNFAGQLARMASLKRPRFTAEMWDMDHLVAMGGMLNANVVRSMCDSLAALMADHDVVVDFWNPWSCIAARASRKPLVCVIQADMHPASQGFIWWKERPPDVPSVAPALNPVLAEYSLAPIRKAGELCLGDLTLVLGTPETDPLPATAHVTYIGPILWQKPGASLPDWIADLDRGRPVIWLYPGNPRYVPGVNSPVDSLVILRACVSALADEDVQVVLTLGHHVLPREFLPLPSNFRHEPFVPGLDMAARSDLLIHHGGYGSCQTGLCTGTPAVIIPTFSERESNARRVAALGAGEFIVPETRGRKKHVSPETLRTTVRRVLSEPSFRANARRVSESLRAFGGVPGAVDLIEGVAA